MSLTLITGPANAAKAGAVLERLRAALPRDPLLVVPTAADVAHYQRELASSGIVFGAEVLTFARLVREIAAPARAARAAARLAARDRVVARGDRRRAAARAGPLGRHARLRRRGRARCSPSSSAPGSTPARFTAALRTWAGRPRAAYAGELGALYSAYRRTLEELGRPSLEGYAWAALDALRADPAVGAAPGVPLRLRRPHADRARRRRDAERARRGRRLPRAAVRAGPRRVRRPRGDRGGAAAARRRGRAPAGALGALRAERPPRAAPPRALAVRAGARPAPAERRRPAARGRRRARRGRARRRRGARADAPGDRGARHRRRCCAATRARPPCSPRCWPATGSR